MAPPTETATVTIELPSFHSTSNSCDHSSETPSSSTAPYSLPRYPPISSSSLSIKSTHSVKLDDTPHIRTYTPSIKKEEFTLGRDIENTGAAAETRSVRSTAGGVGNGPEDQRRSTHVEQFESVPPDGTVVVPARQTWNNPPVNKWRILATFYSFLVLGMNDSAYGALIPYLEKYYNISFVVVSLIFLTPFVGYTLAAMFNDRLHSFVGRRGVGFFGSMCHGVSYVIMALHPPYPTLVVVMCLAGFGSGCIDAAWNSYIGVMDKSNEILGLLHGMYGLGAVLSPIIATTLITRGNPWYTFYYLMIGLAAIAAIFSVLTFWTETGTQYRADHTPVAGRTTHGGRTREALKHKTTWLISGFLWIYVGAEVALGGWIVTFMLRIRNSTPFDSGMVSAGFWIGLTVSRFTLGWLTGRWGEKKMVTIYLILSIGLELLFWLVPHFYVSAVSVALLGYFIGPLFPSAMVVETKLLPPRLHVSGVGFATAVGGSGAAIFPFMVGAIAQRRGVQSMHPVILGLLAGQLGLWLALPRVPKGHVH
ncbi:major facilitator superfamily domain-containing protein [Kalaharituber pfeilii]|nr:major facilitator superfamily domain-containing protein [Kalaharituber pfeilii]